jgi:hypothetical protein
MDFASLFLPPQFLFPPYSFFGAMDFPGKKFWSAGNCAVKTWWLNNGPGLPLAALPPPSPPNPDYPFFAYVNPYTFRRASFTEPGKNTGQAVICQKKEGPEG